MVVIQIMAITVPMILIRKTIIIGIMVMRMVLAMFVRMILATTPRMTTRILHVDTATETDNDDDNDNDNDNDKNDASNRDHAHRYGLSW